MSLKRTIKISVAFSLLFLPLSSPAEEIVNIGTLMTYQEFTESGLQKLTPEEIESLNLWLTSFTKKNAQVAGKDETAPMENKESAEVAAGAAMPQTDAEAPKAKPGFLNSFADSGEVKYYEIKNAYGDKYFTINHREFEAVKKCPDFKKGDEVTFIRGHVLAAFASSVVQKKGTAATCNLTSGE